MTATRGEIVSRFPHRRGFSETDLVRLGNDVDPVALNPRYLKPTRQSGAEEYVTAYPNRRAAFIGKQVFHPYCQFFLHLKPPRWEP